MGATDDVVLVVGSGKGRPSVMVCVCVKVCVTVTVFLSISSIILDNLAVIYWLTGDSNDSSSTQSVRVSRLK